jgi:hypothetical protein
MYGHILVKQLPGIKCHEDMFESSRVSKGVHTHKHGEDNWRLSVVSATVRENKNTIFHVKITVWLVSIPLIRRSLGIVFRRCMHYKTYVHLKTQQQEICYTHIA